MLENVSGNRQRMREGAEKEDKVEVAPGLTVGSLIRFRVALIGPAQGLVRKNRLRRQGCLRTPRYYIYKCFLLYCMCYYMMHFCVQMRDSCDSGGSIGWVCSRLVLYQTFSVLVSALLSVARVRVCATHHLFLFFSDSLGLSAPNLLSYLVLYYITVVP